MISIRPLPYLVATWFGATLLGMSLLVVHEKRPGSAGSPPPEWPKESLLRHDPVQPTLVMFAHPRCPCSRASVRELSRLLSRLPGRTRTSVIFFKPATSQDRPWEESDLAVETRAIPGVEVRWDRDGVEARRFGVETSGQTLLWAPDGRLLFSGGITASRGHEGGSAGRDAIIAEVLANGVEMPTRTAVFGCSFSSSEPTQ